MATGEGMSDTLAALNAEKEAVSALSAQLREEGADLENEFKRKRAEYMARWNEAENKKIVLAQKYKEYSKSMDAAKVFAYFCDSTFADIRAELVSAGIEINVSCISADLDEYIAVSFARGGTAVHMDLQYPVVYTDDDFIPALTRYHHLPGKITASLGMKQTTSDIQCEPLSTLNQADWQILAAAVNMPPLLRRVDVVTEFVVALLSPLYTRGTFESHFGKVMATYTDADGTLRYAAGGGLRPVRFACAWAV